MTKKDFENCIEAEIDDLIKNANYNPGMAAYCVFEDIKTFSGEEYYCGIVTIFNLLINKYQISFDDQTVNEVAKKIYEYQQTNNLNEVENNILLKYFHQEKWIILYIDKTISKMTGWKLFETEEEAREFIKNNHDGLTILYLAKTIESA